MNIFRSFVSILNLFPQSTSNMPGSLVKDIESLNSDNHKVLLENNVKPHITLSTSEDTIKQLSSVNQRRIFIPYSYYNQDMDVIQVFWKNEDYYTHQLPNNINLKISLESNEIIGVDIFNVNALVLQKIDNKISI